MGRIKINDLSEDHKISKDEMKKVFGGTLTLNRSRWTTSTLRILRQPEFMERNFDDENIFF